MISSSRACVISLAMADDGFNVDPSIQLALSAPLMGLQYFVHSLLHENFVFKDEVLKVPLQLSHFHGIHQSEIPFVLRLPLLLGLGITKV